MPKANRLPDGENWHVLIALGSEKEAILVIFLARSCPDYSAPFEKVKFSF